MCAGVLPLFSLRKLPASSSDPSVMISIPSRTINLDRNSPLSKDDSQCGDAQIARMQVSFQRINCMWYFRNCVFNYTYIEKSSRSIWSAPLHLEQVTQLCAAHLCIINLFLVNRTWNCFAFFGGEIQINFISKSLMFLFKWSYFMNNMHMSVRGSVHMSAVCLGRTQEVIDPWSWN